MSGMLHLGASRVVKRAARSGSRASMCAAPSLGVRPGTRKRPSSNLSADAKSEVNPVAIKVMHKDCTSSAGKEQRIYAALDPSHPGGRYVIRLHETFFSHGHACMVFDQHGRTLSSRLREQGPMPVDEVRMVARQLFAALDALHSAGFAHGDIKPGNLLWDDQSKELRVIDLGWARRDFRLGQGIATRDYCPPEMLIGLPMQKPVDLWMAACTIFELLTGECLFDPIAACEAKYKECSDDDESEADDADDEEPDMEARLVPGAVLAGKYQMVRELGKGSFGTVWSALPLHGDPTGCPLPDEDECDRIENEAAPKSAAPKEDGYNIWQVVIGYEHFLQMQELLGPYPKHLADEGKFRHILYDDAGNFRFEPEIKRRTLADRLSTALGADIAQIWAQQLEGMMAFPPSERRIDSGFWR